MRTDDYLSVLEAAADLNVATSTIRRWIAGGDLPAYRLGKRRIAIKRSDLAMLLTPTRREMESGGAVAQREEHPGRPLTGQEQEQARAAVEAAKQQHAALLARRGGKLFSPSWELLNDAREGRSHQ